MDIEVIKKAVEIYKNCGNFTQTAKLVGHHRLILAKHIKKHLPDWEKFRQKKVRPWTEKDIEILKEYPEKSFIDIAKELDRKYISVKSKAYNLGLSLTHKDAARYVAKRNGQEIWTKKRILTEIKEIYPTLNAHYEACIKYPKLYDAAQRYFGSWRGAVEAANFDYVEIFAKSDGVFVGLDNHAYDSRSECIIANFLFKLKNKKYIKDYISHKLVSKIRRWRCDFYIEFYNNEKPLWLEFDGMKECRPQKFRLEEKIKFYKDNKYNFLLTKSINKTFKFILGKIGKIDEYKMWNKDKEIFYSTFSDQYEEYKKELLEDIVKVSKKVGHVPSIREYTENGNFHISTIQRHFMKWSYAIKEAGLWEGYRWKRIEKKQIEELKKRFNDGESHKDIAKKMNIPLSSVKHIYYRHIHRK